MTVMLWILTDLAVASGSPRHIWTYDFVKNQSDARVIRELRTDFHAVSCGQVSKPAIYEHAGILGDQLVEVAYSTIPIPSRAKGIEKIYLHFFTGIQDEDAFQTERGVDGCRFIVHIDGKQVFSAKQDRQEWIEHRINLMRYAGKEVRISFLVDPIRSSSLDQAAWGQPRIYVTGQGTYIDDLAILHGQMPPAPKPVETPMQLFPHPRITRINKDDKSVTMVAVLDETLDLDTQLLTQGHDENKTALLQRPRLVAGEGNAEENHTLVRILNERSIPEIQFLAYPASVRGGVHVQAGNDNLGHLRIVTAPINDAEVCCLRIFNEHGGFVREIPIGPELSAPFVINVGQYDVDRPGEEIVIVSRNQKAGCPMNVLFYGIDGAFITHRQIETKNDYQVDMTTLISPDQETLYIYSQSKRQGHMLESMAGPIRTIAPNMIEELKEETAHEKPFKYHINVKRLSTYGVSSEKVKDFRIGPLKGLQAGDVIEVTVKAKTDSDGRMTFGIYHRRTLIDGLRQVFAPPLNWKYYRFVFRIQSPADNLTLRLQADAKIQIEDFTATRQSERTASPHAGSITFDILE